MLHRYYEALIQIRADADENSQHATASMETLLRVNEAEIPPVPDLMSEKTLPPNLVVPEPLILR